MLRILQFLQQLWSYIRIRVVTLGIVIITVILISTISRAASINGQLADAPTWMWWTTVPMLLAGMTIVVLTLWPTATRDYPTPVAWLLFGASAVIAWQVWFGPQCLFGVLPEETLLDFQAGIAPHACGVVQVADEEGRVLRVQRKLIYYRKDASKYGSDERWELVTASSGFVRRVVLVHYTPTANEDVDPNVYNAFGRQNGREKRLSREFLEKLIRDRDLPTNLQEQLVEIYSAPEVAMPESWQKQRTNAVGEVPTAVAKELGEW
jgi:hypothetical protein